MTVSIHQPNFFPWFPYFQKIKESDIFVILSHCQFEKNNYQNRFEYNGQWFTMSVRSGLKQIEDKRYDDAPRDWRRIKKGLPKFDLSKFDECISHDLFLCNSAIIHKACRLLKIKTQICFDYPTELTGTARLVDLCKNYGATKYLSGISGKKYLDLSLFEQAGIEVLFQDESTMIKKSLIEML